MNIDPVVCGEYGGAATLVGAFVRWVIARVRRLEQENEKSHADCQKQNAELRTKIAEIEKRSYDAAVADRTMLITTLERNTAAVDKNSAVLERFSKVISDTTPSRGTPRT